MAFYYYLRDHSMEHGQCPIFLATEGGNDHQGAMRMCMAVRRRLVLLLLFRRSLGAGHTRMK
jgi:hypothetical protein